MNGILKLRKKNPLLGILLWVYAGLSVYPLLWMVFYSLKNNNEIFVTNPFGFPTHLRFENYVDAWSRFNVPVYFSNSLLVAAATVVGTIVLSVTFSYAVARMQWRWKEAARIYVVIGMFIPVQVIMIPLAILVREFHLANTYWALIVPYIAFNISFSSMVFYGFFRSIPVELEESACMDGASIYRTFYTIILPIIKPAIATMVIFVFLSAWNEFTMALILITKESLKTLPLGLLFFQGQFTTNWGAMGAAMTIASLPTVLVYVLFSEQVEKALTVGSAVKG
ncbi:MULTISPECIES: carbohydrate ABC transporter permease [unclassified Paenibacillus]|uniref:carbohydrate ABC transporter permease n=1 Tax=unclassified Paenibacillus TaxID=185978 RepID=UPI00070F32A5|nr:MULTISPECIES: carbohydrate ABC transporter permease [unclassified Paenibacillus]KQX48243.1 sugar ABC transporter permease [Paenibacillus sp. Root444D2]KRE52209.1 sugar ABC transporter permease [Paenibacillus sp. Soil724D2]